METRVLTMVGINVHFGSYFDVFGNEWVFLDEERIAEDKTHGDVFRVIGYTTWDFSGNVKQVVIERTPMEDSHIVATRNIKALIKTMFDGGIKIANMDPSEIAKEVGDMEYMSDFEIIQLEEELESFMIGLQEEADRQAQSLVLEKLPQVFDFKHFLGRQYHAELTKYGTYLITFERGSCVYSVAQVAEFVEKKLWEVIR